MPVHEGEDGKLHYSQGNEFREYANYEDWYDNGPGSERFKRELRSFTNGYVKGFPPSYPSRREIKESLRYSDFVKKWKEKVKQPEKPKEYITDEDLEINV